MYNNTKFLVYCSVQYLGLGQSYRRRTGRVPSQPQSKEEAETVSLL